MKRIIFILTVLLCVSAIGFAGGQQEGGAAGEETITLRYWDTYNEVEDDVMGKWIQKNVEMYQEQNPNIKIELTNTPNGDQYLNKISTEIAANNTPDVFMTWVAGRLEPFVEAGRIEPLNSYLEASSVLQETINKDNCSATTFDGKIYAFPTELAGEVVYYNKAVYADHALEPPATWEELMSVIKKFRGADMNPFSLANKDPWPGTIPYMAIFHKLHGPEEYKKTNFERQAVFNTEPYVEAAEYLVQLVDAGAYPKNFNSLEGNEGVTMFRNGQAAMRYCGTWELPDHIKALGDDLDMMNWVSMPNGKGQRNGGWLQLQNRAYAIGSSSEYKDQSAQFIEYMFTKERQKVLAEAGFMIATQNIPYDESKLHPVSSAIAKALSNSPNPMLIWDVLLGQNVGKELNLATQAILGGADIQKTLDKLNRIAEVEWD